jgi:hypothetical protein
MNARTFLISLVAAASVVYFLKTVTNKAQKAGSPAAAPSKADNSQVVHLVEETLHQHEGEDNPIVHAFEAALEQETKHSNGLVTA